MTTRKRILTGDRPTGKLHLGHYVGSLQNRVRLQDEYDTFVFVADVQALTTHFERTDRLAADVRQVALDNIAAGLDPEKTTYFIQSMIPEIAELTAFYSMFVTVNTLRHNPTIKAESQQYGYADLSYGFLGYPISQTADITFCKADLVPVGEDQLPHMELTRKIVRRFNDLYKAVLPEPQALLSDCPRLVGLDGKAKMGKSLGNGIYLSDPSAVVAEKVNAALTDPARVRASDKGTPSLCTVNTYHSVFNDAEQPDLAERCKNGSIGCVACKKRLHACLDTLLDPMRERRAHFTAKPGQIDEILQSGTAKARLVAQETMREIRDAMQIRYF